MLAKDLQNAWAIAENEFEENWGSLGTIQGTKEDAIAEAKDMLKKWYDDEPEIKGLWIGKIVDPPLHLDVYQMITESIASMSGGLFREMGHDWFNDISTDDLLDLEKRIKKVFEEWQEDTENGFWFYEIDHIEYVRRDDGE